MGKLPGLGLTLSRGCWCGVAVVVQSGSDNDDYGRHEEDMEDKPAAGAGRGVADRGPSSALVVPGACWPLLVCCPLQSSG